MFGSVTSTWGANNNQQQQQQQQPSAFGQPSTGFGTSAFGSTGTSAFGQNTTQQPPANPMFGGGTTGTTGTGFGAFGNTGGTTTSAFGAPKPATGFGAFGGGGTSTGTSAFGGGGTGAFGQNNTSTTGTTGTGLFGQPAGNTTSAFGSGGGIFGAAKAPSTFGAAAGTSTTPQPITTGSSNPPFAVHQEKDPSNSSLTLQYQSISCMPAYANTSVEELRVQDYAQGRKTAGAATGGFGQTSAFGSTTTQPATTGLFGQPAPATQSAFAPAATANTGTTGGFGAFGSNANTTTQPASTSIFGGTTGTSAFGQPQQQQNQPATTGFGAFGSTQPQQPTTSIFGGGANNTTSAFGSNAPKPGGFGAFGSTNTGTTTGGFGTSAFGQQNQQNQQQPTTGLFGNTAQPAATNTTGFGAFGANTQNQAKPLFGATNTTQPAATGFGAFGANQQQNQQQQQPQQGSIFGGGLFGNQPQQQPQQGAQPATTSLFGNANTNTNPAGGGGLFGGGLFGNTQQNQQQQQQQQPAAQNNLFGGGGLFGNKPAATGSIFGSTPAATNPAPTTGLFGSTLGQQPAPQNTGFSGGLFGNKPANAMNTSMSTGQSGGLFGSNAGNTGGLFGNSTANGPAQGTLTASIAQPIIGSDLAIFDMLGPGPRTLNLDDSTTKKKAGFFVDVPIRAPVPRSGAYTPANSKLRGFGTSVNGSLGSSALSFSSGSPNALSFSRAGDGRSSADPLALMRSGSSPALGSGARQSVKKVILDKKVEPTELFRKSGSPGIPGGKIVFSPALSIAAREKEAREALAASNGIQDSPTPAARKQHTPNRFTAQPTQNVSGDGSTDQGGGELEEGDYWVKPDLATLKKTGFDELSSFSGLVIGKVGYGEIHFLEPVDLTGLPKLGMLLGEVVRFDDKECSVYPDNDEAEKPPPGSGLNVKARLILYRCWAMDKATREPIKDPSHPAAVKHVKRLKHMKETQFEDFDWKEGKWTFTVKHF